MMPRFLAFVLLSFAFGAMLAPAWAADNCMDYCIQAPGALGQSSCATQCSPGGILDTTHPWETGPSYGAIAYGAQSTANGYAWGKASAGEANRAALGFCQQHGSDCKVVASFVNTCAAVAAVKSAGRYATGEASTRNEAQANAMKACQAQGGGACEIEVWTCATP